MASAAKHAPKPPYRPAPPRPAAPQTGVEDNGDGRLALANVEGRIKAKTVKKVGDLVESHPDETLTILRGWLHNGH